MDLEEIGFNAGNWVDSAQDRNFWRALVNAALNLRISYAMKLVSLRVSLWPGFNLLNTVIVEKG